MVSKIILEVGALNMIIPSVESAKLLRNVLLLPLFTR